MAGVRKEARTMIEIAVRIRGMDADGRLYNATAITADVTTTGARLRYIRVPLHRGCVMNVQRENGGEPARFRVAWADQNEGEVSLQLTDVGRHIWGVALQRQMGDTFEPDAGSSNS